MAAGAAHAAAAAAAGPAGAEATVPTAEDWSERDQKIVVRTTPGSNLLADLVLRAKVDASPDEVYGVLTHPDSHSIFRGIRATLERRTLSDDGRGRRELLVRHQAVTRFLWLHVTFSTTLLVHEDDTARTITFRNAREGGFMREFTGRWEVLPFTQASLDRVFSSDEGHHKQRHGFSWFNSPIGRSHRQSSLVTLEQAIAPRVMPPGPLMRMVRGLCARTVSNMMADLQKEIERRRAAGEDPQAGKGTAGGRGKGSSGAAAIGGHEAGRHAASLSARALDLFASSAPLCITVEL